MSVEIKTIISNSTGRTAFVQNGDKLEQHVFPVGTSDADIYAKFADSDDDSGGPDIETLKARAKELGIKGYANCGVETLVKKIAEKEKELNQ